METLTLGTMQFTAVVLMALLTFKLMVPHKRSQETAVATTARWLMTGATSTLVVHFLLQLTLGLRSMGVTQSVMLNLVLLIPASYMFSRAVLLLQRHGRLRRWDRWAGPLNDYYDSDTAGMLRWMQLSIVGLMLLALMVPFAIFTPAEWNGLLFFIAIVIYFFIFYLVDSFCYYLTSNAPQKTQEAEESRAEEEQAKALQEVTEQTERAVEQWTARGGHRTAGITSPVAAAEIGIPRYQLTAWVKQSGYESFSQWMTALRIDEAKRVLLAHPDWGSEAVADYCGFNSRQYFHTVFRQHTGITPTQYQQHGTTVD